MTQDYGNVLPKVTFFKIFDSLVGQSTSLSSFESHLEK
jgi:hypothetical protein